MGSISSNYFSGRKNHTFLTKKNLLKSLSYIFNLNQSKNLRSIKCLLWYVVSRKKTSAKKPRGLQFVPSKPQIRSEYRLRVASFLLGPPAQFHHVLLWYLEGRELWLNKCTITAEIRINNNNGEVIQKVELRIACNKFLARMTRLCYKWLLL